MVIEEPDYEGKFKIIFSKPIMLPANCTEWNESNQEDTERITIEFLLSVSTEDIIFDQDLDLTMTWQVVEVLQITTEENNNEVRRL